MKFNDIGIKHNENKLVETILSELNAWTTPKQQVVETLEIKEEAPKSWLKTQGIKEAELKNIGKIVSDSNPAKCFGALVKETIAENVNAFYVKVDGEPHAMINFDRAYKASKPYKAIVPVNESAGKFTHQQTKISLKEFANSLPKDTVIEVFAVIK